MDGAVHSQGRHGAVMAVCFLVAVLEGYDLQVISSAAPHLEQVMSLTPEKIGMFFSSSLIGLAIGAVLGGWIADKWGRKPVIVGSVLTLGLFTLATALSRDFGTLIAMRVLAGLGLGGAMPTVIALIAEITGGHRATSAVTTMICGQPTGGIISALVGRTLAEQFGWQSLFVVGGLITLVIVPLLIAIIPETKPAGTTGLRPAVARMPPLAALFGGGRGSATVLLWIVFILTLALLSALLSWAPLLVIAKGLPRYIGLNAVIAINVGGIIGSLAISRLIDRMGTRLPMLAAYAIMAVSLGLFAQVSDATAVLAVAVLVGFSVLGAQFALYGVAPRLYPFAGRGSGVGVAVAMGRLGAIAGPIIVGSLVATHTSPAGIAMVLVPTALVAGAAMLLMGSAASLSEA